MNERLTSLPGPLPWSGSAPALRALHRLPPAVSGSPYRGDPTRSASGGCVPVPAENGICLSLTGQAGSRGSASPLLHCPTAPDSPGAPRRDTRPAASVRVQHDSMPSNIVVLRMAATDKVHPRPGPAGLVCHHAVAAALLRRNNATKVTEKPIPINVLMIIGIDMSFRCSKATAT